MKFSYEKEDGVSIECTFGGNVQDYALMWLNLCNNARENKNIFKKISNYYDSNDITVVCMKDKVTKVLDYLKRIGLDITSSKECTIICPYISIDTDEEFDYEISSVCDYE